jgi:hypothetical protein
MLVVRILSNDLVPKYSQLEILLLFYFGLIKSWRRRKEKGSLPPGIGKKTSQLPGHLLVTAIKY